ncbi:MAG: riboflavin synthase [Bacteroidota bacterium]
MFTGIIEFLGEIKAIRKEGSNIHFDMWAPFPDPIQVDQSIAHDGVCLTVTHIQKQSPAEGAYYAVTAVEETLDKTSLSHWNVGRLINIERCMKIGDRLDGHFVQGHVDTVGKVLEIQTREGSWIYEIGFDQGFASLLVNKGSICVNGVSLTVIDARKDRFTLTIIPFTYTHTSFQSLVAGEMVNLEFDILGKYILRMLETGNISKS